MKIKLSAHQYFWIILLAFLAACAPAVTPAPSQNFNPTASITHALPTLTPTAFIVAPTPMPTQPIISLITPDAIQIERWREYQGALAMKLLPPILVGDDVLCEWEILGQSDQEIYVWAVCQSSPNSGAAIASMPAVIHLGVTGAAQSVEIPGSGTAYARDIRRLFPIDVREKFDYYHFGRASEMSAHLEWRRIHPEEPPLVVLSATPTP